MVLAVLFAKTTSITRGTLIRWGATLAIACYAVGDVVIGRHEPIQPGEQCVSRGGARAMALSGSAPTATGRFQHRFHRQITLEARLDSRYASGPTPPVRACRIVVNRAYSQVHAPCGGTVPRMLPGSTPETQPSEVS
jgi:hypothetical protein